MNGETEMRGVWCGWWSVSGHHHLGAKWNREKVSDEVVLDVLADNGAPLGRPIRGIHRIAADAVNQYVEICFGPRECALLGS